MAASGAPAVVDVKVAIEGASNLEGKVLIAGAVKAKQAMKIDGNIDDWSAVPAYPIATTEASIVEKVSDVKWNGTQDCSLKARLAWDEQNLYILAQVSDDRYVNNQPDKIRSENASWWNADCIEVFLDVTGKASLNQGTVMNGKYHLEFVAGRNGDGKADWMLDGFKNPMSDIQCASSFSAEGYVIEIAIPLKNFPSITARPGAVVRMDLAVDDCDQANAGRRFQMIWSGYNTAWKDTRHYASVIFLP